MNENPTSEPLRSGPLLAAVEAQIEYIRFLEACLSSCSPYLAVHNWRFPESDIQRGEQLRANIAEKLKAANVAEHHETSGCRTAGARCAVAAQDPRIGKLTREEAMSLKAFAEAIGAADCMPLWMAREIEEKTAAVGPQNVQSEPRRYEHQKS